MNGCYWTAGTDSPKLKHAQFISLQNVAFNSFISPVFALKRFEHCPRRPKCIPMLNASAQLPPPDEPIKVETKDGLSPKSDTYCGFATLLGPSNSGKSTLVNHLVGQKVAIVTPKVQTTRCRISGIATYNDTQVVFLDTPGIFSPTNRLSRAMVKSAWKSGGEGDVVSIILDAAKLSRLLKGDRGKETHEQARFPDDISAVFEGVAQARSRGRIPNLSVCANKMDIVKRESREKVIHLISEMMSYFDLPQESIPIFPISARHGDRVEPFQKWVVSHMPRGPWLYAEDDMTDMPSRQLAAEVTREKLFLLLQQELPYEVAVETTSFKELSDASIRITQDILVSRDSQKRIVTGKGGSVVKAIGSKSRAELSQTFGTTVHLMLTVRVRSKWKEEKWQYQQWGLDFHA